MVMGMFLSCLVLKERKMSSDSFHTTENKPTHGEILGFLCYGLSTYIYLQVWCFYSFFFFFKLNLILLAEEVHTIQAVIVWLGGAASSSSFSPLRRRAVCRTSQARSPSSVSHHQDSSCPRKITSSSGICGLVLSLFEKDKVTNLPVVSFKPVTVF